MKAIISVHDKTGLTELASGLLGAGYDLVASGGTAAALAAAGLPHETVEQLTGSPEMLGGRVKTLHPRVHGGILADLSNPAHVADLQEHGIDAVGVVACNLYPFREQPSVETIDIGGVALLRAAAKNWSRVLVAVDPADYPAVVSAAAEASAAGGAAGAGAEGAGAERGEELRRRLAEKVFAHTAAYDAAIAAWLGGPSAPAAAGGGPATTGTEAGAASGGGLPETIVIAMERAQGLRYGENPHQVGARYRTAGTRSWWDEVVQHGGMELSYLNLYDADAAWSLVHDIADLGTSAAVVVKHANPCGAAVAGDLLEAYEKAFECDPMSAFGGIVALSGPVGGELARAMVANAKADVVIAPGYSEEALEVFAAKRKNMRTLQAPPPRPSDWHVRQVSGGWLVQSPYRLARGPEQWEVVTTTKPSEDNWRDLELAWRVCAAVKSNAIVLVANGMAVGIGGGQQNRVSPGEIAVARAAGRARGGAAASDAFFPFRDGLDTVAAAGISCVAQPGGSLRDAEVIAAAEEHGIAMVFTGERQFRH